MTAETGRSYHNTSSVYCLPNDTAEQDRLDVQSSAIKSTLEGRVILAPLPANPSKILDIGCGTGHASLDIARQYPSAQVYGLDITPVPERAVSQAPPNLHFLTRNIFDVDPTALAGAHEAGEHFLAAALQSNTFTHVFARMIFMGMNDWPGLISRARSLLAPGGYLELQELDCWFTNASGEHIAFTFEEAMSTTMQERGIDMRAGSHAAERLRAAGFVDVEVHRRPWTIKALPGEPESEMTRYISRAIPAMMQEFLRKHVLPQADRWGGEDVVQQWLSGAKDEDIFSTPGSHSDYFVTIGRKPEAQREKSD
ncbi:S-adenosyl-L-methionine-dependent methyltransferase [Phyllosticta citrichinensis]|uniref:S-adenosyl-L-methionine-dependent methyltransferase n=1 Tax=Phyllosticta citrichinensis TaxID=1130410 RepID=A0ABR1XZH1_9PEZI